MKYEGFDTFWKSGSVVDYLQYKQKRESQADSFQNVSGNEARNVSKKSEPAKEEWLREQKKEEKTSDAQFPGDGWDGFL